MNNDVTNRYNIAIGVLCFVAFILLFLLLGAGLYWLDEPTIRLPILLITGVMALFATLALVAVTFSVAGLSDETQALGLPEGSVRAAIALSLIVIFAITVIYFYSSMLNDPDHATAGSPVVDFAKQVIAVIGTLVTSVASFYFASRAVSPAKAAVSTPTLTNITPAQGSKAAGRVSAQIVGTDLQLTKSVNLEMGSTKVPGLSAMSNEQLIKCDFVLDPALPLGKYDVVVATSDGATATLPSAFEVVA